MPKESGKHALMGLPIPIINQVFSVAMEMSFTTNDMKKADATSIIITKAKRKTEFLEQAKESGVCMSMLLIKQGFCSHLNIIDFLVEMGLMLPGWEDFTLLGEESTKDEINKICL